MYYPTVIFLLISCTWAQEDPNFDGRVEVKFFFYTRSASAVQVELGNTSQVEESGFNPKLHTKLITHGFTGYYTDASVQNIKNAYLATDDYNVICIDWHHMASSYDLAIPNNHKLGSYIGTFILWLVDAYNIRLQDVHVMGHSLGGQMVGFVGDVIKGPKVGRITGLDPARVPYEEVSKEDRLDSEDADFVDVYHTSTVGLQKQMGHIDFYPNGGINMTGCSGVDGSIDEGCDHAAVINYFADSIYNPVDYLAHKCDNIDQAISENCSGSLSRMGEYILTTTSGVYYQRIKPVPSVP